MTVHLFLRSWSISIFIILSRYIRIYFIFHFRMVMYHQVKALYVSFYMVNSFFEKSLALIVRWYVH